MKTTLKKVEVNFGNGKKGTVSTYLRDGEKVVTASAAISAVLSGKTIRPLSHGPRLEICYVKGKGLEWTGPAAAEVTARPDYLWETLNKSPGSMWIVPGEPSQRGKWFDGASKTHLDIQSMSDGHVDNALNWLAIKTSEFKNEKKRRVKEAAKAAKEAEAAKAKLVLGEATFTKSNEEALRAFIQGKKVCPVGLYSQPQGFLLQGNEMLFCTTFKSLISLNSINQNLILTGKYPGQDIYTGGWEISK